MSDPTWLGVPAVDEARVGPLELEVFSLGGEGKANVWLSLGTERGRNEVRLLRCTVSNADTQTVTLLRSLALLDPKLAALVEAAKRVIQAHQLSGKPASDAFIAVQKADALQALAGAVYAMEAP